MMKLKWETLEDGTRAAKVPGGTVLHVPSDTHEKWTEWATAGGTQGEWEQTLYPGGVVFIPDPPVELVGLVGEFEEVDDTGCVLEVEDAP